MDDRGLGDFDLDGFFDGLGAAWAVFKVQEPSISPAAPPLSWCVCSPLVHCSRAIT